MTHAFQIITSDIEELKHEIEKLSFDEIPESDMSIREWGSEWEKCINDQPHKDSYKSHPTISSIDLAEEHNKENIWQNRFSFNRYSTSKFADSTNDKRESKIAGVLQNSDKANKCIAQMNKNSWGDTQIPISQAWIDSNENWNPLPAHLNSHSNFESLKEYAVLYCANFLLGEIVLFLKHLQMW